MKNLSIISFCFLIVIVVAINDYECDYSFGDQSWSYSKLFHNNTYIIESGLLHLNVVLPQHKNEMISFVCVNIMGADLSTTKVSFASLFRRVSVVLLTASEEDVAVNIIALEHGY